MARGVQDFNATAAYFEERMKRARNPSERARLFEVAAQYRAKAAVVQAAREQKWREREAQNSSSPQADAE
jgi:hypothetical protein